MGTRVRSAKSGEFVERAEAKKHPETTVSEKVGKRKVSKRKMCKRRR